jgi:hypothetical protein
MAGSGDILRSDKGCVVSPTRALVVDDGGHIRILELRTERGHRGGVGRALDRLALEPVQDNSQML